MRVPESVEALPGRKEDCGEMKEEEVMLFEKLLEMGGEGESDCRLTSLRCGSCFYRPFLIIIN